jgi:hypothetical protein
MATQDTPTPIAGDLGDSKPEARSDSPALRASGLPTHYAPGVAGYAGGPLLEPATVTPSDWRWRRVRTVVVQDARDGLNYRAIGVTSNGDWWGWWAVERLGEPHTLPELEH